MTLSAAGAARAQDASGYAELAAGRSSTRSEDATGRRTESEGETLLQRYSLDWRWRPYANVTVLAGGLFEREDGEPEGDGGMFDTTQRKLRPYLTAAVKNPLYSLTFGYHRNEDDLASPGFSFRAVREIYNSTLGWRPENAPSAILRFIRTRDFDADRQVQDTTQDLADLVSEYRPVGSLRLYVRAALEDTDDRLSGIKVRRVSEAGRVSYADAFLDRRLQINAEYNIQHRESTITTAGVGEVATPIAPIAGLAAIGDNPADVALLPAPALINGDRTDPSGINLGLPPVGGDERPRHVGLDFGGDTAANTIDVWVDRDLPAPIAASFAWEIYTSADNITWALRETVAPAGFIPFERRFEIRFAERTARYLKAVTRPLLRSVPSADAYPEILVTECGASLRVPARSAEGRSSLTTEIATSSVRARILEKPGLDYEMSHFIRQAGSAPSTFTLSNGLSLRHAWSPIYSAAARVAREDSRETRGDRASYLYTASLRAVPLNTLSSSIVFSGRTSEIEGLHSRTESLFLYTTAELYRGVNADLNLGRIATLGENGEESDTHQINAQATLVPHATATLNLLFHDRRGTRRGGAIAGTIDLDSRLGQASLTYRPVGTLYFFVSYGFERASLTGDRFVRAYSASWSPFPDGRLQVQFSYDDTYRSDLEAQSRVFSPRVRWNITDRWYLELAYQDAEFDSALETRETEGLTGSMRIWF